MIELTRTRTNEPFALNPYIIEFVEPFGGSTSILTFTGNTYVVAESMSEVLDMIRSWYPQ